MQPQIQQLELGEKVGWANKISKILSTFFGFQGIILMIIVTVFGFLIDGEDIKDIKGVIQYVGDNLKNAPIEQIKIESTYCQKDYIPMPIYTFKGTKSGCECGGVIKSSNCDQCSTIPQTYEEDLIKWRGKVICAKRLSNFIRTDGDCPTNYVKCNKSTCIHNTQMAANLCPITEVKIIENTDANYSAFKAQATGFLDYTAGYTLFFWRKQDADGVFILSGAVDNDPCLNKENDPPLKSGLRTYPLSNNKYNCGKYGYDTTRSIASDKLDYYIFLTQNNMEKELQVLPQYQQFQTDKFIFLFYRQQIQYKYTNKNCGTFESEKLDKMDDIAGNIKYTALVYFIIKFVFGAAFLFTVFVECISSRGKIQKLIPVVSPLLQFFSYSVLFFLMVEGSIMYTYYLEKEDIQKYFKDFGKYECFDDSNLNKIFKSLGSLFTGTLDDYSDVSYVAMWWSAILVVIISIFHVIQCFQACFQKFGKKDRGKYLPGVDGYVPIIDQPYLQENKMENPYSLYNSQKQQTIIPPLNLNENNVNISNNINQSKILKQQYQEMQQFSQTPQNQISQIPYNQNSSQQYETNQHEKVKIKMAKSSYPLQSQKQNTYASQIYKSSNNNSVLQSKKIKQKPNAKKGKNFSNSSIQEEEGNQDSDMPIFKDM